MQCRRKWIFPGNRGVASVCVVAPRKVCYPELMLAVLGLGGVSGFTASASQLSRTSVSGRSSHLTALADKSSSSRGKLNARIIGAGAASPDTRVSNVDLEAVVETSDEWIAKRTGAQPMLHNALRPYKRGLHLLTSSCRGGAVTFA